MALLKETIKAQIVAGITEASKVNAELGVDKLSDILADVIINAIKTADLTIQPGTIIVSGSPSTQTNASPIVVPSGLS